MIIEIVEIPPLIFSHYSEAPRQQHLDYLYDLLAYQHERIGGYHYLANDDDLRNLPYCGIYFFFERGEQRANTGALRVVRAGTHALSPKHQTSLRSRLINHRGTKLGGGNHRGSSFRKEIGCAVLAREEQNAISRYPKEVTATWGLSTKQLQRHYPEKNDRSSIRSLEEGLEQDVSKYIASMSFLWIDVPDWSDVGEGCPLPSPVERKRSHRGFIEEHAIRLLSNRIQSGRTAPIIDPASTGWLGHYSPNPKVRASGMWCTEHTTVDALGRDYDPDFLLCLAWYVTYFQRKNTP